MRYRLPEAFSDFVFAIVVEEYGVIFACIVILCYLIVLYRVGVMAKKATLFFPTLLAIGISTQIMMQALVNMCVSTGIAPVTGQNLPFISQGGSSLIITCVMFGILLSVSRSQNAAEEKEQMRKARLAEKEAAQQESEGLAVATLQNLNS
jgi:cell division protein FtsW